MAKRWRIAARDSEAVHRFSRVAQLPPVVAQLLLARGVNQPDAAQAFLDARMSGLQDPETLPGLSQAADVVWQSIQAGDRITIYGDYDADGMTATAILVRCLSLLSANVDFYVPHRLDEGYGLNEAALRQIAAQGSRLVVTVDCGIASPKEAAIARELELNLVITDHHEFGQEMPHANAIVHPRLPYQDYPFESPCGAGVAFKLAWAICQRASNATRVRPALKNFLMSAMGLAAIGTVADVVPLVDENRLIVRHGLNTLREQPFAGIAALSRIAGVDTKPRLSSEDIAFSLAPRLNAAGRLGQAELAIELLTTDSDGRAAELAEFLDELNRSRDGIERSIYLAADKQLKERFDTRDPALVLAERGWHAGVIGIVAGRLAEKYSRPVVMIALDELGRAIGQGSARSALGLDLHETLTSCSSHLVSYGGHAAAAGLRIDPAHVENFRQEFCQAVAARIPEEKRVAELQIEAESPLPQLTIQTVNQIERLAPFGAGNPRPLLCATHVHLADTPRTMGGGDRHLALKLKQQNVRLRSVAFGRGDWADKLAGIDGPIDIAYRPVINEFRGRRSVELHLVDWRPTAAK